MTRLGAVRVTFLAGAAAGLAAAAALRERPALEQRVRERIQAEAFKRGLVARVDGVRVGLWPPVLLTGVRLEKPGQWSLTTDKASLSLRARGPGLGLLGRARLTLGATTIAAPAGLTLDLVPTVWDVVVGERDVGALSLRQPATGLILTRQTADRGVFEVRAEEAPLGSLLELRRGGVPLLDAGVVTGRLGLRTATDATSFDVDIQAHGMRMAVDTATAESEASFGPPAEVQLSLAGGWHGPERRLDLTRWRMTTDGVSVSGSLSLDDVPADPRMDLAFDVERVDLARLLALSTLDAPVAVAASVDDRRGEGNLGSASLSAHVTGTLSDAASFRVEQQLDFDPPPRTPPQIERLRGAFAHEVTLPGGGRKVIDVSRASPDFVPLREVPPLLLQTLLLGEDAGFFGHGGIDLSELPSAILTNWSRGESARGASTITQQLAKNLFLSREKRLGRKLQEVALALLLESAIGKERILEIYLNVIEWGPGLYGLRPAARRYFGKEPDELAPAQMALLVALIPGPLKYQRSLASGTPSPGFRPLVDRLLAKLRSVDALSEDQYYDALADDLRVTPGSAGE
jgi:hypothetical protein